MASTKLVHELWTGDHFSTADAVADHLRLDDEQREYLMAWIVNGCRGVMRAGASRAERHINTAAPVRKTASNLGNVVAGELDGDPRLRFLEESFCLEDGTWTTWRHATVADHESSIRMYEKLRGSAAVKIDKHKAVIAQLTVNKVRSLGELYPAAKAAAA